MKTKGVMIAIALAIALSSTAGMAATPKKASAEEVTAKAAKSVEEYRYYDAPSSTFSTRANETETITYTTKEVKKITLTNEAPTYMSVNELTNACGAVAGTIVVGFYDKYYENLIPDYMTYTPSTGKYKAQDLVYIPETMTQLYTLMKTNVVDVGVSEQECVDGLREYVENRDLSIQYSSVKTSSTLNYSAYCASIDANKPVLFFCDKMTVKSLVSGTTTDKWITKAISGLHVAVGYGYYEVKYYSGTNNFRTDKCLMISTGWSTPKTGYVNIKDCSWLVNGYSVTVS